MRASEVQAFLEWLSGLAPWHALFLAGLFLAVLGILGAKGVIRGVSFDAGHRAVKFGVTFMAVGLLLSVPWWNLLGTGRQGAPSTPTVVTKPADPTITPQPNTNAPSRPAGPTPTPRPGAPAGTTVGVYFSRNREADNEFGSVFPVDRTVQGGNVATAALEKLIEGPTPDEQRAGYYSDLGSMLSGPSTCGGPNFQLAIEAGTATVRFCRGVTSAGIGQDAQAQAQVESTLRQFPNVQRVRLLSSDGRCLFDASGQDQCLRP